MNNTVGYIYILTNPSFPQYIKIGYADDVNERLNQLNRSECTPFAFRVYATYSVSTRLTDMKLHDVIDKLNPDLRSIDIINGKKRIREFYAMSKEDAYALLEAVAEINGLRENLKLWELSEEDKAAERAASEIQKASFRFSYCGIHSGDFVQFYSPGNEHDGKSFKVIDDKHIEYNNTSWSLSALAQNLRNSKQPLQGPKYFKYNGKLLTDLRSTMENDENE